MTFDLFYWCKLAALGRLSGSLSGYLRRLCFDRILHAPGTFATVLQYNCGGRKRVGKNIHCSVCKHTQSVSIQETLREECELLGRLHHPSIVQFLGVHEETGSKLPQLVMESPSNFSGDLSTGPVGTSKTGHSDVMIAGPGTPCYRPSEALIPRPRKTSGCSLGVHMLCGEQPFLTDLSLCSGRRNAHQVMTARNMSYGPGNEVQDALAMLASCESSQDLSPLYSLLKDFFSAHSDPYSLLLAFLCQDSKSQQIELSLPIISLEVFQEWLAEREEKEQNGSIAVLKPYHQSDALDILLSCHSHLIDPTCSVFKLKSADRQSQLSFILSLLDSGRHKKALRFAWKFELQDNVIVEEILLPLLVTDQVPLIENFIGTSKKLQESFVLLLDRFCEPGTTYKHLISCLATCAAKPKNREMESKLSSKKLFRLGLRFIRMFGLKLETFPNISERKFTDSLRFLLFKKYVKGEITDTNLNELIETAVHARPHLQAQLIKELVRFQDFHSAAHWVKQLSIPVEYISPSLKTFMSTHTTSPVSVRFLGPHNRRKEDFYQLPLPLERVFFVADERTLQHCLDTLIKPGLIIGVDCEASNSICSGGTQRMALLQFATYDAVFLLDMVNLPRNVSVVTLRHFIKEVFGCSRNLKIGYSVNDDLSMLGRSWSFVADIVAQPQRMVDLRTMIRKMELLHQPRRNSKSQSVPHSCSSELHSSHFGENTTSGSPGRERGLSKLVMTLFGKPLDKIQQLSDWERRPLREEQIKYAALDAYCLLGVYEQLKSEALSVDPHFNVEPCVHSITISKSVFRRAKKLNRTDLNLDD